MVFSRSHVLLAVASLAFAVRAYDNSTQCNAFGMDFQDGGSYFINSASTDNFTSVTQFTGRWQVEKVEWSSLTLSGCNPNSKPANVWFVPPSGNEMECSTLPTTPDSVNQVSSWQVVAISK
jgi:hypothetical protein